MYINITLSSGQNRIEEVGELYYSSFLSIPLPTPSPSCPPSYPPLPSLFSLFSPLFILPLQVGTFKCRLNTAGSGAELQRKWNWVRFSLKI